MLCCPWVGDLGPRVIMTCAFRTRGIAFLLLAIPSLIVDKTPGAVRCAGGRERPHVSVGRLKAPKSGVAPALTSVLSAASFVSWVFTRLLPPKAWLQHRVKNLAVEKVQCVVLTFFTRIQQNPPQEQCSVGASACQSSRSACGRSRRIAGGFLLHSLFQSSKRDTCGFRSMAITIPK